MSYTYIFGDLGKSRKHILLLFKEHKTSLMQIRQNFIEFSLFGRFLCCFLHIVFGSFLIFSMDAGDTKWAPIESRKECIFFQVLRAIIPFKLKRNNLKFIPNCI